MPGTAIIHDKIGISAANLKELALLGVSGRHEINNVVNQALGLWISNEQERRRSLLCKGCSRPMELDEATQSYFCPQCGKDD